MDFWARILGGGGVPVGSAPTSNPQQRLARFKRLYNQVQATYDKSPLLAAESSAADTIRTCLSRLTNLLHDEARSPAPHPCLQYASSAQIYITISRIGAVAQHEAVIREAAALFAALIDSEEDEFLGNPSFARFLMLFVERTCGVGNPNVGEDTESEIIEILFGIAAKIRLEPEILPVWFQPKAGTDTAKQGQKRRDEFIGVTSKEDFPLCYQLIDHVFHEGKIGDFSRTGLLYIFESASKSQELEQWIVESDLPTLMATGLGALYSQLSRKLSILHPDVDMPVVLALSDYRELKAPREAESLYTNTVQGHLDTFLSYLLFWQDVFENCHSVDVKQTLLDHFQLLFMEQLLYPSLLESSDMDGGSSVAVLTYLHRILRSLDAMELVDLILQYLFALSEDSSGSQLLIPRSPSTLRRRASLLMLTEPQHEDDRPNPSLFSLSDLINTSITSSNPQTVIAALQVATVALEKDHPYCISTLLQTMRAQNAAPRRTHGALNAEIDVYIEVASSTSGGADLDEAYEYHLKDAQQLIESHSCSMKLLVQRDLSLTSDSTSPGLRQAPIEIGVHYLRMNDPFVSHLLFLLRTFLTNNVELNLSLTAAFTTLASCPLLRLEGWLCLEPSTYQFDPSEGEEDLSEALRRLHQARRRPKWAPEHTPPLLTVLQSLQSQIQQLASIVPEFVLQLAIRRKTFRLHDEITDAMTAATLQSPTSVNRGSFEQRLPSPHSGTRTPQKITLQPSRPQRVETLIDRATGSGTSSPSRSQSPRGRNLGPDIRNAPTSSPSPARLRSVGSLFQAEAASNPSPSRSRPTSDELTRRGSGGMPTQISDRQPSASLDAVLDAANTELLHHRIKFPLSANQREQQTGVAAERVNNSDGEYDSDHAIQGEASLSHILTNTVILQEFILEIVAILQVRASMFSDVLFVSDEV